MLILTRRESEGLREVSFVQNVPVLCLSATAIINAVIQIYRGNPGQQTRGSPCKLINHWHTHKHRESQTYTHITHTVQLKCLCTHTPQPSAVTILRNTKPSVVRQLTFSSCHFSLNIRERCCRSSPLSLFSLHHRLSYFTLPLCTSHGGWMQGW